MKGIKNCFISHCFVMICCSGMGQNRMQPVSDSLRSKSYEYLLQKIENDEERNNAALYASAFLLKAKSDKNWQHMVTAYKALFHESAKEKRIHYADSMIWSAKHTGDNDLIGSSYLTKGIAYYALKDYGSALDNYLIADGYISGSDDMYLQYKIRYNIAQIKYYLGHYEAAEALFADCVGYFKSEEPLPYLTSLHSLGLCYNRLEKFDLCTQTNEEGIKEASRLKYYDAIPRFINSEGINQYYKKNYAISIAKLNETLPNFKKSRDFAGETITYFYLGKNYWSLNQREKAVGYFLKVDKAFIDENFMRPDLRENYELLIEYYKQSGDLELRLKFIDHLLLADKYLQNNFRYLSTRIHKEYDTKELQKEKIQIEKSLRLKEKLVVLFIILIAILVAFLIYTLHRMNENKRRFNRLMDRTSKPQKTPTDKKSMREGELDINPEVVASVLKHLDRFEQNEKYLAKDLTLPKLAKKFDSNIVYVSKIISHYRQKKSVDYINDLKIEYIIRQLKSNNKFRNYTNKALAEEAGFSTTQHFTRAFLKNTGISPTYFIKQLNKSIQSGGLP